MNGKSFLKNAFFWIGLIVFWQFLYTAACDWLHLAKPYAFPSPIGTARSFFLLLKNGTLLNSAIGSLLRAAAGFGIAVVIGVLLGVSLIRSNFLSDNLRPLILGIQTLPSICWVPFAVLWFGLSQSAVIFVVVMGCAFGIAITTESCIKNVPPIYIKAAKTMGVDSHNLYRLVILPAALPSFIAGLKQGWSFSWRALMSGEVMSSSMGLGYTLMIGRDLADINQVAAVMLVIVGIGILIDKGIFCRVEARILKKRGL